MKKPQEDSDIIPEDLDDSVVSEENAAETIKKLREKLRASEAERVEYLTGWQRAKADMVNARKRDETDKAEFAKFANERLIEDMIPVLENYDMARSHAESWDKVDKTWRIGIESIFNQLKKALSDNGLSEIDPLNDKFDHTKHEAVSYDPVMEEKLDHIVIGVVQKGYSLNGKIIKPAKVKVGEYVKR